jgi:radical SAM-linked protein
MWTYRIKYTKEGLVRFISHLDTMRVLKRALSRADIPVAYSQGFNPRPKISMGPALQLGCESRCEAADIVLIRSLSPERIFESLGKVMPEGIELLEVIRVHEGLVKLSRASGIRYMIELPTGETLDHAHTLVRNFMEKVSVPIERVRKDKRTEVDVRRFVIDCGVAAASDSAWLSIKISTGPDGTCSPPEVLQAVFDIPANRAKCLRAVRTEIIFEDATPNK